MNSDEFWQAALEWRDIEKENCCMDCGGSGKKTYANTATWRGGVGGMTPTGDVCNRCWGSGDRTRPWPSWRTR